MARTRAEIVVIGAGAVGAAVAYQLARRGRSCVVVEQFALGHTRGSSHGAARITRHSYADPDYARLMIPAFRCWRELEAEVGRSLYIRTGGVSYCPKGVDYVDRVCASLSAIDVPHARMNGAAWNARYPLFSLHANDDVVFEPDAGILLASRAHASMLEYAQRHGCRLIENLEVLNVEGSKTGVLVRCEGDQGEILIETERCVVAAGGWVGRLLPQLDNALRPTLQHVYYVEPPADGSGVIGQLPVFIFKGFGDDAYYGMPAVGSSGVKVARHGGLPLEVDSDRVLNAGDWEGVHEFLKSYIAGLAHATVVAEEPCVYTMEREERFVVGQLEDHSPIWVASPCSGHGFKFSCYVGKVVCERMLDGGALPLGWIEPATLSGFES